MTAAPWAQNTRQEFRDLLFLEAGFPNLGTIDILDQVILCGGRLSWVL